MQPFTPSLTARIQWLTLSKSLKLFFFETVIGEFSGGYFMNKANDCLMIGRRLCLNSDFLLHTDKNQLFCVRD